MLVERPTYLGALQAWSAYQAEYLTVNVDADGMRTEELAGVPILEDDPYGQLRYEGEHLPSLWTRSTEASPPPRTAATFCI